MINDPPLPQKGRSVNTDPSIQNPINPKTGSTPCENASKKAEGFRCLGKQGLGLWLWERLV